jgi:sugar phosphate isomerase/epimerase
MFVACSTICFAHLTFDKAMRRMADLEFDRVEYVFGGESNHDVLKPAWIADQKEAALQRIRTASGLLPSSFDIRFETNDLEEQKRQFEALCWMAKAMSVAVLSVIPSPKGVSLAAEQKRLRDLLSISLRHGLVLTVTTASEGATSTPAEAVALCRGLPALGLTLDPSHYINGPFQSANFDEVYPFVQNARLRDTGRKPGEFQMKIGQGQIEYNRVVSQLQRSGYKRGLVVAIEDRADSPFEIEPEVRKLKLVLESLL